jgi:hypothetical protein
MGNRGHNGFGGGGLPPVRGNARTSAEVAREQAEEEARMRGSAALKAALRPGGLLRLTHDAYVSGRLGPYEELSRAPGISGQHSDWPRHLRKGAVLMMVKVERVDGKGGVRRACYTFLAMGTTSRVAVIDMSLLEPRG